MVSSFPTKAKMFLLKFHFQLAFCKPKQVWTSLGQSDSGNESMYVNEIDYDVIKATKELNIVIDSTWI